MSETCRIVYNNKYIVASSWYLSSGYCKLKEEALDHTLWRTHSGRNYGLVRQTKERKKERKNE